MYEATKTITVCRTPVNFDKLYDHVKFFRAGSVLLSSDVCSLRIRQNNKMQLRRTIT